MVTTNQKQNRFTKNKKERNSSILQKKVIKSQKEKQKEEEMNEEELQNNWKTRIKMAINTYLSIITLNVNGPNAPLKRHSMAD